MSIWLIFYKSGQTSRIYFGKILLPEMHTNSLTHWWPRHPKYLFNSRSIWLLGEHITFTTDPLKYALKPLMQPSTILRIGHSRFTLRNLCYWKYTRFLPVSLSAHCQSAFNIMWSLYIYTSIILISNWSSLVDLLLEILLFL